MYRAAQAAGRPAGPELLAELVRELADIVGSATAFIAVFTDDSHVQLGTLAAVLDGKPLRNFQFALGDSARATVVGRTYRHVASGAAAELPPDTALAAQGMDSSAALPLDDSAGHPLGLLVAMDRKPMADAALAEALLRIFAVRAAAEIERLRAGEALERVSAGYRAIFDAA